MEAIKPFLLVACLRPATFCVVFILINLENHSTTLCLYPRHLIFLVAFGGLVYFLCLLAESTPHTNIQWSKQKSASMEAAILTETRWLVISIQNTIIIERRSIKSVVWLADFFRFSWLAQWIWPMTMRKAPDYRESPAMPVTSQEFQTT